MSAVARNQNRSRTVNNGFPAPSMARRFETSLEFLRERDTKVLKTAVPSSRVGSAHRTGVPTRIRRPIPQSMNR